MRGRRGRIVIVATCVALVAAGCSSDGSDGAGSDGRGTTTAPAPATATTSPSSVDAAERYEEVDCPMDLAEVDPEVEVTCGELEVPENREDPDSATITLAVATLHSRAADPRPDPVVQLEGGPGFGSLVDVAGYSGSKLLDERDYVLWDQRGTGYSTPSLDCTEADDAVWGSFATNDEPAVEGARVEDAMRACRARLVADGVDLDGYDTVQNAADLADLRVALGIDEWNLRGISYGSALAIETVRDHPEGLRSVLLDSVVVPDEPFGAVARGEGALRSFAELDAACAADPACAATYGDVDELMARAAASLDADPHTTTVEGHDGEQHDVSIDGGDLYAGLFKAMYDETLIPVLPAAMTAIAAGDRGIIDAIAKDSIPFVTDQVEAMTTSVDCADREAILDPASLDPFVAEHPEVGTLVHLGAPETGCEEWGVEPNPAPFNELLTPEDAAGVPILVMAGRFDPVTPSPGTTRVAEALGLDVLLFPNAGHGAVGSSDCARTIWFAFLDDPTADPDTTCMADLAPPDFA